MDENKILKIEKELQVGEVLYIKKKAIEIRYYQ